MCSLPFRRSAVVVRAPRGRSCRSAGRAQRRQGAQRRTPERGGGVAGARTSGTIGGAAPGGPHAPAGGDKPGRPLRVLERYEPVLGLRGNHLDGHGDVRLILTPVGWTERRHLLARATDSVVDRASGDGCL